MCSMFGSNCCFLYCIEILRRQIRWSGSLISKNFPVCFDLQNERFGIVNKAEVDAFLDFSCFLYDPTDDDNMISGSSTFSKTSLNIWKFSVHILLKPGLEF